MKLRKFMEVVRGYTYSNNKVEKKIAENLTNDLFELTHLTDKFYLMYGFEIKLDFVPREMKKGFYGESLVEELESKDKKEKEYKIRVL